MICDLWQKASTNQFFSSKYVCKRNSYFYIQKDVLGISEVNFSGNKMIEKSINKKPWKFRSLFYFEMINTCHRLLFSSMKILIPRYNMTSENLYVLTYLIHPLFVNPWIHGIAYQQGGNGKSIDEGLRPIPMNSNFSSLDSLGRTGQ